jgi:sulfite exporter TauE/SafE
VSAGAVIDRGSAARYFLGRTSSYVFVGALAGGAAKPLVVRAGASAGMQLAIALCVAVVLVASALRSLKKEKQQLVALGRKPAPGLFARAIEQMARIVPKSGLGLGVATGFFPCGALAAGLLAAATSGSAGAGALSMLVFALASAPGVLVALTLGDRVARWLRARTGALRALPQVAMLALAALIVAVPAVRVVRSIRDARAAADGPPPCPYCHHEK